MNNESIPFWQAMKALEEGKEIFFKPLGSYKWFPFDIKIQQDCKLWYLLQSEWREKK